MNTSENETMVVDTVDAGSGIMVDVVDRVAKVAPKIAKKKPAAKNTATGKVTPASLMKKVKDIKVNKVVRAASRPKSEAVVAKEKESAKLLGLSLRCYRLLKAIGSVDARLNLREVTAKSGVIQNHLPRALWGASGEWGTNPNSLGNLGLIRRYDDHDSRGYRVGLTAKGAKLLAKATAKSDK